MREQKKNLYMLAIMPPDDLRTTIEEIRLEFAEKYHCKAALKPPVHITLIPPYFALDNTEEALSGELVKWAGQQHAFSLEIRNYNAFKRNGVIFLEIVENDALQEFHKMLMVKFKEVLPFVDTPGYNSYHPHITIGYRDIPREVFPAAVKEYLSREFSRILP